MVSRFIARVAEEMVRAPLKSAQKVQEQKAACLCAGLPTSSGSQVFCFDRVDKNL
jgi:hypothetical protein